MWPRSGFWYQGTSECTLVLVFGTGEHPPKPPFWKPPFCEPPIIADLETCFQKLISESLLILLLDGPCLELINCRFWGFTPLAGQITGICLKAINSSKKVRETTRPALSRINSVRIWRGQSIYYRAVICYRDPLCADIILFFFLVFLARLLSKQGSQRSKSGGRSTNTTA